MFYTITPIRFKSRTLPVFSQVRLWELVEGVVLRSASAPTVPTMSYPSIRLRRLYGGYWTGHRKLVAEYWFSFSGQFPNHLIISFQPRSRPIFQIIKRPNFVLMFGNMFCSFSRVLGCMFWHLISNKGGGDFSPPAALFLILLFEEFFDHVECVFNCGTFELRLDRQRGYDAHKFTWLRCVL